MIEIFLSSGLQTKEEQDLYWILRSNIESYIKPVKIWTIGIDVKPPSGEISRSELKYIKRSDAIIAIVAKRWPINGFLHSYSVHDEIDYAYQLGKPIYLFTDKENREKGGLKAKANHFWEFEIIFRGNKRLLSLKYSLSEILRWIKEDVIQKIRKKSLENWEDALPWIGLFAGGLSGGLSETSPDPLSLLIRVIVGSSVGYLAGYGAKELVKSIKQPAYNTYYWYLKNAGRRTYIPTLGRREESRMRKIAKEKRVTTEDCLVIGVLMLNKEIDVLSKRIDSRF